MMPHGFGQSTEIRYKEVMTSMWRRWLCVSQPSFLRVVSLVELLWNLLIIWDNSVTLSCVTDHISWHHVMWFWVARTFNLPSPIGVVDETCYWSWEVENQLFKSLITVWGVYYFEKKCEVNDQKEILTTYHSDAWAVSSSSFNSVCVKHVGKFKTILKLRGYFFSWKNKILFWTEMRFSGFNQGWKLDFCLFKNKSHFFLIKQIFRNNLI